MTAKMQPQRETHGDGEQQVEVGVGEGIASFERETGRAQQVKGGGELWEGVSAQRRKARIFRGHSLPQMGVGGAQRAQRDEELRGKKKVKKM